MVYTDRAQACSTGGPYALASKLGHGNDIREVMERIGTSGIKME